MLSERFKKFTATIRFRLTLWMIVVVFLLVVVVMASMRQIYRARLHDEFDRGLGADVERLRKEVRGAGSDWRRLDDTIRDIALAHYFVKWFAEVYDESGRLKSAGGFRDFQPSLPTFAPSEDASPRNLLPYRVVVARLDDPGLPVYFVRVGGDRQSLEDDLRLLDRAMVIPSLAILLFAPLGGYVLSLRATRPISKIIAAAARLQPRQLTERLPIRGTGDELDQLSRTINGMLDRLADFIERNREFVSNAAHELRSPLAAIRGSVEVALNRHRSAEEYDTLLAEVMEECQYLSNLVNRLLILAEGDAGRLGAREQTTRLDKIVRESVDMFEAVAESHGVRLAAAPLSAVVVPGDEFHLRQVVRNLIDNAVKFSPNGSQVTVALQLDHEKKRALLTVGDQGPGISADHAPHIFERFYRGDKARQREAGRPSSGLGLSICRAIVQALEGDITVASQPGQGSTFTVSLPCAPGNFPDGRLR